MDLEDTIKQLQEAKGEPLALALASCKIALASHPPEVSQALTCAAFPRWFDVDILTKMLPEALGASTSDLFTTLIELPFCSRFELKNGYSIHESTRFAIRRDIFENDRDRFTSLSQRAASAFVGVDAAEQTLHEFWVSPQTVPQLIEKLSEDPSGSRFSFATSLVETDSTAFPADVQFWGTWATIQIRGSELTTDARMELANRCVQLAEGLDSEARELAEHALQWENEQDSQPSAPVSLPGNRAVEIVSDLPTVRVSTGGGPRYAAKATRTIFLSAVSNEFASYRREVCEAMRQPGLWIESQENFLAFGVQTLIGLDNCIRKCDAVVQLVGQQTGESAPQASVDALLERNPNLPHELGVDEEFLRSMSYTQWEAWLAILHNKSLFLCPSQGASPDNGLTGSDSLEQERSCEAHVAKLKEKEHHLAGQLAFRNVDELKFVFQKHVLQLMALDEVTAAIEAQNNRFSLVTNSELINRCQIPRDEAQAILEAVDENADQGVLLVAAAGFGKSCILSQVIEELRKAGTPHLAVKLDSIPECGTAKAIGEELKLTESPVSALQRHANGRHCVLVIDQLDAISTVSGRKTNTWIAFEEMRKAAEAIPGMKVVIACRDFDLQQDHRLRPLGADDSGFEKVTIGPLSTEVLRESLDAAGMKEFLPTEQQKEILSLPLHLLLFLQGYPDRPFSRVGELYSNYWGKKTADFRGKREQSDDVAWHGVLEVLTSYMSNHQRLLVPNASVQTVALDVAALESVNVLIQSDYGYQFFHESFFDYAYARLFCQQDKSVVAFLTEENEEQHLFRRAQVRQILGYRRENDPNAYYADLKDLLGSENVRFHIKRMVASEFHRVTDPRKEEWEILMPYLLETDLSRYVSGAMRSHEGWFDQLNELGIWAQWLDSTDDRLINAVIWFIEAQDLHKTRSSAIANLVSPYAELGGDWDIRLKRIMSWGVAHCSPEMADVYFTLVERGAFDDEKESANAGERGLWRTHYNAEKENPRFIIDLVVLWFIKTLRDYDDGTTGNFFDRNHQNKSHTGALTLCAAAAKDRSYFLETILPVFVDAVRKTELQRDDRLLNRIWPYLSNFGEPHDIDDAILTSIRRALESLAADDPAQFRQVIEPLKPLKHETICYLLLSAFAASAEEYADESIEYILAHKPRLNIGFGSWMGSGNGESAVSRMAIRAATKSCSPELLTRLENEVIGYADAFERSTPGRRGYSELLVLRSIDLTKRSDRVAIRIDELECGFPGLSDELPSLDDNEGVRTIGSPIPKDNATHMTDEQWVSAMQTYDGSTDRFDGGPIELSRVLCDFAHREPERFARLVLSMPEDIDSIYFSAVLDGLSGRGADGTKEEKQAHLEATPTKTFVDVTRRLHGLPDRPCGTAIVHCIEALSPRELPDELLEITGYYAINDPDPDSDIWQDAELNYYGGDPFTHGINCVRGQAAMTICRLLQDDFQRFNKLRPAIKAVVKDQAVSVRSCALCVLTALLNHDRDLAVEWFVESSRDTTALWQTDPFARFIHYATRTHYPILSDLLAAVLESGNEKAVENTATKIAMVDLGGIDTDGHAQLVRSGTETMRKAAAHVYAQNIEHEDAKIAEQAAEYLMQYFYDASESVGEKAAHAFWHISGKRLFELQDLLLKFVESPAFGQGAEDLLRSLEQSTVELPHIVTEAARKLLGILGEEATSMAYRRAMTAGSISKLVVRQYAQTTDPDLKRECLDLIDEMERSGYLGISDELGKVDR